METPPGTIQRLVDLDRGVISRGGMVLYEVLCHYYMRYSGPAGMTEQDDMENWNYASAASKGTIARRYPYNYQMAMGVENPNDVVPGLVTDDYNEQNQRGMYRRWTQLMEAENWAGRAPVPILQQEPG